MRLPQAPLVRGELYGDGEPALDDPAELFHEASKLHPALAHRQGAGLARLAANEHLQSASAHAVRRNPRRRCHRLPRPQRPKCSLWHALDRRRSRRDFTGAPLSLAHLATLLDAGYGLRDGRRRTVPSGGALYPFELHVAARAVGAVQPGVYRYDPELHALEEHELGDPWPALEAACPLPGLLDGGCDLCDARNAGAGIGGRHLVAKFHREDRFETKHLRVEGGRSVEVRAAHPDVGEPVDAHMRADPTRRAIPVRQGPHWTHSDMNCRWARAELEAPSSLRGGRQEMSLNAHRVRRCPAVPFAFGDG